MPSTYQQFMSNDFSIPNMDAEESIRNDLINNILYLLQNVDPTDQNTLIKRKISRMGLERFNLAESLVKDDYYPLFLKRLDKQTLQRILNEITSVEQYSLQLKPQTVAALRHVLKDEPMPSPRLAVKEAMDTFGNFFANTLRETEDAQYKEENVKRPKRTLEQRELKLCGTPAAEIFSQYIPLLKDPTFRDKFNGIIRSTLLNPNISTYQLQINLLHAASRLADALGNSAQTDAADQIRVKLKNAGFRPRVAHKKAKNSLWQQIYAFPLNFIRSLRPSPLLSFRPVPTKKAEELTPKISPTIANQPAETELDNSNSSAKLNDLLERISRMQQTYNNPPPTPNQAQKVKEVEKPQQPKNLTFSYNNMPKKPSIAPRMLHANKQKPPKLSKPRVG